MRLTLLVLVAVLLLLPVVARAAELQAGALYFPGGQTAAMVVGAEQAFGSWKAASFSADVLVLSTGSIAGAIGTKAKVTPAWKLEGAYAFNHIESDISWRNLAVGVCYAPPILLANGLVELPARYQIRIGAHPTENCNVGVSVTIPLRR